MVTLDLEVARLAGRQHGLLSRRQAKELGATDRMIAYRLRTGRWSAFRRGVFAIAGSAVTWEQRLEGCVLAIDAPATHRASAALWNVSGFYRPPPELSVVHGRRVHLDGARVHQSVDLDRVDLVERNGILTTPLDRTVLDLGAVLDPVEYGKTVRDVIRRGQLSWMQLHEVLVRHSRKGRDGCGRLRIILEEEQGLVPTMSHFEDLLEALLLANDLPRPVRQHPAYDKGGRLVGFIDLCYPEHMVAIEADGLAFHGDDYIPGDRRRQNRLELEGWLVLRYTWDRLMREGFDIVREVREALAR